VRVLVTGATGLVGCHTVAALQRAGHDVRALVRSPERMARALGPLTSRPVDHRFGDVTDRDAVERALEGCDAAVHAAALLTFDRSRYGEMQHTNVEGTRIVLEAASRRGLDPIVYVSSVSALLPADGHELTLDAGVKSPRDPYGSSKASAERIARDLQEQGAPITITYPAGVWGPNDPTLHAGMRLIFSQLRYGVFLVPPTGMSIVDARDLAELHEAALAPGKGPRRYLLGGHFLEHGALAALLSDLTARRLLRIRVPGPLVRAAGRIGDLLRDRLGFDVGALSYESMLLASTGVPCDDSRAIEELGVRPRPTEETARDTLLWLHETGFLQARHVAGLLRREDAGDGRREPA
jgi:nucleoside-diphosphate-sugar epimerase